MVKIVKNGILMVYKKDEGLDLGVETPRIKLC